jgi:hypothetical protein
MKSFYFLIAGVYLLVALIGLFSPEVAASARPFLVLGGLGTSAVFSFAGDALPSS